MQLSLKTINIFLLYQMEIKLSNYSAIFLAFFQKVCYRKEKDTAWHPLESEHSHDAKKMQFYCIL